MLSLGSNGLSRFSKSLKTPPIVSDCKFFFCPVTTMIIRISDTEKRVYRCESNISPPLISGRIGLLPFFLRDSLNTNAFYYIPMLILYYIYSTSPYLLIRATNYHGTVAPPHLGMRSSIENLEVEQSTI